jgi:hypothetical protein
MDVKEKLALIKGDFAKRWAEAKVEIKGISDKSEKVAKMLDFLKQLFIALDQKELLLASQFTCDLSFEEYDEEDLDGQTMEDLCQRYKKDTKEHGWYPPMWLYTDDNLICYAECGRYAFWIVRLALVDGKMMYSGQLQERQLDYMEDFRIESDWMPVQDIVKPAFWTALIDVLITDPTPWLYDDKYAAMFPKPKPEENSAQIYDTERYSNSVGYGYYGYGDD